VWRAGLSARRATVGALCLSPGVLELNEAGTSAATKSRWKGALDPLVAKYQSRAFKVSGDAVPMEFGSAINSSGNIAIRIGTNLGDVMVEGSDLGIALQSPSFCPIEQTIIPPVGQ